MILGYIMQYENILYKQDNYAISGFINSNGNLEHNIYKQTDGGYIDLEARVYSKDELSKLLAIELDNFVNRNVASTVILGHNIRISSHGCELILTDNLDDEVYEISQSILDGVDCGEIHIESLKEKASWSIVQ
jgi:superfamily II helicase